jgi:hypothetical protein
MWIVQHRLIHEMVNYENNNVSFDMSVLNKVSSHVHVCSEGLEIVILIE